MATTMPVPVPKPVVLTARRWPRFIARTIDSWWEGMLLALLMIIPVVYYRPSIADWLGNIWHALAFDIACIPFVLLFDAVVYWIFGNTPGKKLLGLRAVRLDGRPLSYWGYTKRNLAMWFQGMAFAIPIISLFTMAAQASRLGDGREASYDEGKYRVGAQPLGLLRKTCAGAIFVIILAGTAALRTITTTESPVPAEIGLKIAARKINSKAPIIVGSGMRLDRAVAGPGASLTYFYTLTSYDRQTLPPKLFEARLYPILKKNFCSVAGMRRALKVGAKFFFEYADNDGSEIAHLKIDRGACGY